MEYGLVSMLALLTVGTWGSVAIADGNPHVAEAIAHAESGADHGGQGHPDAAWACVKASSA